MLTAFQSTCCHLFQQFYNVTGKKVIPNWFVIISVIHIIIVLKVIRVEKNKHHNSSTPLHACVHSCALRAYKHTQSRTHIGEYDLTRIWEYHFVHMYKCHVWFLCTIWSTSVHNLSSYWMQAWHYRGMPLCMYYVSGCNNTCILVCRRYSRWRWKQLATDVCRPAAAKCWPDDLLRTVILQGHIVSNGNFIHSFSTCIFAFLRLDRIRTVDVNQLIWTLYQ